MATKKISELSSLTTPASDDLLAIVDTSGAETMKITYSNLTSDMTTNISSNTSDISSIYATLGLDTTTWSSSSTYSTGDIVVYNYKLYENLTGTNTSTTPDSDTTNWEETSILTS